MYYFSGKIKCLECGGNYRGKMQRSKTVYICSTYNKDSTKCRRYVLKEEDLIDTVRKHIEIYKGKRIDDSFEQYVKIIEVKGSGYTIIYADSTVSILDPNRAKY